MVVLGVILLLGVGVVTATIVANGSDEATLNMVGLDVTTSYAGIYGIGALNLLLVVLALFLLLGGAKKSRRRRGEVRRLRREADQSASHSGDDAGPLPRGPGNDRTPGDGRRRDEGIGEHFEGTPRE